MSNPADIDGINVRPACLRTQLEDVPSNQELLYTSWKANKLVGKYFSCLQEALTKSIMGIKYNQYLDTSNPYILENQCYIDISGPM